MRSSNPVITQDTFRPISTRFDAAESMTVQGVIGKTLLLLVLAFLSASTVWTMFYKAHGNSSVVAPWMIGGMIAGFVLAIVTVFKKEWASVTAPLYAIAEGLFLGGLSAIIEAQFPGIVIQATGLTFGTLFAMLLAYQSGWIQATEKFKLGVVAATGGIAIVYLVAIVLGFFGVNLSFITGNGLLGIGFSLFVVVIAALNFILDFDAIEQGCRLGVPKYMEWYGAFAMMVTLVWLYIEFLRLLSKLRSR